mmetsp:Transcript_87053/g.224156  ORF Transcript_87053/g.224156 Transcript_87053/m.224156 type:complete len:236 (+) Transcript_87053:447-1154(+)
MGASELRHRACHAHLAASLLSWCRHAHGHGDLLTHHALLAEDHLLWRHAAPALTALLRGAVRREHLLLVHLRGAPTWRLLQDEVLLHHLRWASGAAHGGCATLRHLVRRALHLLPRARTRPHGTGARALDGPELCRPTGQVRLAQHLPVRGALGVRPVRRQAALPIAGGPLEEGLQDVGQGAPQQIRVLLVHCELRGSACRLGYRGLVVIVVVSGVVVRRVGDWASAFCSFAFSS